MRELLYVPPGRRAATGVIGLLVPELANPIFPALAQAIETRAAPSGLASILCNTQSAAYPEVDYVHMLLDRGVDGMIFISCEMTNLSASTATTTRLIAEGARHRVRQRRAQRARRALGRRGRAARAGELATRHLIELGHRRIGFVAGPGALPPDRELKGGGREAAMTAAGLVPNGLVAFGEFSVARRPRGAARGCWSGSEPPTAVICSSRRDGDRRAAGGGAARAARAGGPLRGRLRRHRLRLDASRG